MTFATPILPAPAPAPFIHRMHGESDGHAYTRGWRAYRDGRATDLTHPMAALGYADAKYADELGRDIRWTNRTGEHKAKAI